MQVEGGFSHAAKLYRADFGKAPEAFDAVDMVCPDGEFIGRMIDPVMLLIAQIDYSVIGAKTVGMDNGSGIHLAFDDRVKRFAGTVGDDLGIDLAVSFVNTEDDRFAAGSASSLAADTLCTKVRFVQLDLSCKWRFALAIKSYRAADQCQITIDRITV